MRYRSTDKNGKWLLDTLPYNAFYFRGSGATQEEVRRVNSKRSEMIEKYRDYFFDLTWDDYTFDYESGDSCMFLYGTSNGSDPKNDPRLTRLLADHWMNISECGFFFSNPIELDEVTVRALEQWGFKIETHITVSMPEKK